MKSVAYTIETRYASVRHTLTKNVIDSYISLEITVIILCEHIHFYTN